MPKVSIIIPVYNVEQYLTQALDSVVNQTLPDLEIICVNDCSTDNSLSVIKEYAQKDSRITIINHEKNTGVAKARNDALDVATSDYIMFLDPDDWYELNACELAYNQIVKNGNDFVLFNYYKYFDKDGSSYVGKRRIRPFLPFEDEQKINLKDLDINWISGAYTPMQIYKKDFLNKNNIRYPNCKIFEDTLFYTMVIALAKNMSIINKPLYYYRTRATDNNLTSRHYLWREMIKGKTLAFKYVESLNDKDIILQHLIFYIRTIINWFLEFNNLSIVEKRKFYNVIKDIFKTTEEKYSLSTYKNAEIHAELYKFILEHNFYNFLLKSFLDTIFSFKDSEDRKRKILTIFGVKVKFKNN